MELDQAFGSDSTDTESHWLAVSDLMAGLMVFFLFLAILPIRAIVHPIQEAKNDLYRELREEFSPDERKKWNMKIGKDKMIIRFNEPTVFFDKGKDILKKKGKIIVGEFFPRYIKLLYRSKHRKKISEVRIEGYASSEWEGFCGAGERYLCNMDLSQKRAFAVLKYAYSRLRVRRHKGWLKGRVTANGLSSSRSLHKTSGEEDLNLSRRVEFRILLDLEERIAKITKRKDRK